MNGSQTSLRHRVERRKDDRHRQNREAHHQLAASRDVGQPAAERLGEQHHEQHHRVDQQELIGADIAGLLGQCLSPLDRERKRQIVRSVRHRDDAERLDDWLDVGGQ
jgi:hypothetical protein